VRDVLDHPITGQNGKLGGDASWAMACVLATAGDRQAAEEWRQRSVDRDAADAQALPFNRLVAQARFAACASDSAEALRLLHEALAAGLRDRSLLGDPAFAEVRGQAAFGEIAKALSR
jgi:hypothetical protein